jgi:hypothetical protein
MPAQRIRSTPNHAVKNCLSWSSIRRNVSSGWHGCGRGRSVQGIYDEAAVRAAVEKLADGPWPWSYENCFEWSSGMTTTTELQIFSSTGRVLGPQELDPAAIKAIDPKRCAAFQLFYDAAVANATAEAAVKAATDKVSSCVVALRAAQEHLDAIRPKPTFMDLWRASCRGQ